ncbi:DUF1080 domain-containing protein [Cellulophaga sp. F20128]|uniref:family 16 glycoside hydrolase n=1 Tax=Cellulophaga sp. F20128 TaxID=2926413 RepID=UPI001FF1BB6E|nr:family 16 glycoside hydrolase [Cellulophaga sp. F20128]MCK0157293.1 DUF1080 domain-containing protein [Cellulophaga sp. F20128]
MSNKNSFFTTTSFKSLLLLTFILLSFYSCHVEKPKTTTDIQKNIDPLDNYTDWSIYRGDKKGNQYSELAQIHAANVHNLALVWQYQTGDATKNSSIQVNPIIVDGLMYISSPSLNAIALDATTGEEVWVFNSSKYNENQTAFKGRTRGVTYWSSKDGSDQRIFLFVKNRVYALEAKTGKLITSFGINGHIDLRENLDMDINKASIEVTSPGIIYENFLIVGSRVPEGYNSTPGNIRAYDAITGKFKWVFRTIPKEGDFGFDTWQFQEDETYGGANAWSGFTVDEKRGWVFLATGSPAYDFYGGHRKGENLFGNCVLALNAKTGERIWHYQTVHHDIWDYDNPSAPILITIDDGKEKKDAVVQLTKMGFVFVLDRETGKPLFPTLEMPVPKSEIDGEEAWPTQPMPTKPLPLSRQGITEADLTDISPESNEYARKEFNTYKSASLYTPPSERGTLTSPSVLGGVEWQGGSYDPYTNILYVNANNVASISKLKKVYETANTSKLTNLEVGHQIYLNNCASCHGIDRTGIAPLYPAVINLIKSKEEIAAIIKNGKNTMPSFSQLTTKELDAITEFIAGNDSLVKDKKSNSGTKTRYLHTGYSLFLDQNGYPGTKPPWGTLNAIDMSSGDYVWKKPLGEYPELVKQNIRNTGTLNYGGAVATAGGLIFIAATADEKFRAFEKSRGRILWEYKLPAGGYATPSVFMQNGRQYIAIVAGGGGKNNTPSGDSVMVFALPENNDTKNTPKNSTAIPNKWISLFDGKTLDGWVHMNGSHSYSVENGAIIGRTTAKSANSFLCSLDEFENFELECEVKVDDITNQGIQFRSSVRPITEKNHPAWRAGRVWGPQLEIRRKMGENSITTGLLYGEALGTGWISSKEKIEKGHDYFIPEAWNKIRIVADGPRIQTFVNGHLIEDIIDKEVYKSHPKGFIALQVHGINGERQFSMGWRNIKIRSIK